MKQFYSKEAVLPKSVATVSTEHLAETGHFFAGGKYVPCHNEIVGDDLIMAGQVYVEVYVPREITHPYPLLLIEGNNQTGVGYLQTLEGKPGWVFDFLEMGYVVYVMDQPSRGRSVCHSTDGDRHAWPAHATAAAFCKGSGRWPGEGKVGDPIYDAFYASQVDALKNTALTQQMIRNAAEDLLEKTGPVILVCHSQSGPFAWILGNDHPDKIKAMISIEPSGPPFTNVQTGAPLVDKDGNPTNYGICSVPLDFDPPLQSPADFKLAPYQTDLPGKISGYLQAEPARQLPKLKDIPAMILTSETSYHAPFDHLTAAFLRQAGADVTYTDLQDAGIHGNGHMMMVEENSSQIAQFLDQWITKQEL